MVVAVEVAVVVLVVPLACWRLVARRTRKLGLAHRRPVVAAHGAHLATVGHLNGARRRRQRLMIGVGVVIIILPLLVGLALKRLHVQLAAEIGRRHAHERLTQHGGQREGPPDGIADLGGAQVGPAGARPEAEARRALWLLVVVVLFVVLVCVRGAIEAGLAAPLPVRRAPSEADAFVWGGLCADSFKVIDAGIVVSVFLFVCLGRHEDRASLSSWPDGPKRNLRPFIKRCRPPRRGRPPPPARLHSIK